ncbi:SOS response-associated peptidase family protein [Xanthomonas axonopodis pv. vasculorum]|uniref:SOS response-associated peptidase family protein n=1 Tax=Xanthomonas axonopodis TaxID=53413 RepID=UPI001FD49A7B|nr:SOS response-associated peptidase family protein [Xanthomonas axonopodis]
MNRPESISCREAHSGKISIHLTQGLQCRQVADAGQFGWVAAWLACCLHPGTTYNARLDNLQGFWREQLGYTHGLVVVGRFYENVEGPDGNNPLVQFQPSDREPMLVACVWSRWTDPAGEQPDLLSFAAITDEPEPEVAAVGHDQTIINIKPEHVDAWLNPDPANLQALYEIFDGKRHPDYEHKLAV